MSLLARKLLQKNIAIYRADPFLLKSCQKSHYYINLRETYNYPDLISELAEALWEKLDNRREIDAICGVPTGGLSFAYFLAQKYHLKIVYVRKEPKEYGTGGQIDGSLNFRKILILEDTITTGASMNEIINILSKNGVSEDKIVRGAIVSRGDFPENHIKYAIHISDIPWINPFQRLEKIAKLKNSNIIFSADTPDFLEICEKIGDYIVAVKIHSDIYYSPEIFRIAHEKNFLVIDDRKFADIARICGDQMKVLPPVDFVTMHAFCGEAGIQEIQRIHPNVGVLVIADMSSYDFGADYGARASELAEKMPNCGLIAQKRYSAPGSIVVMTPGISLEAKHDNLNQKYSHPASKKAVSDYLIIGRDIYLNSDPIQRITEYNALL